MIEFSYQGTPVRLWTDQEMRLMEMGGSFIAVNENAVNIEDLCSIQPSKGLGIVRCSDNPGDVIQVIHVDQRPLGCVAGWISEDDQ